jgi:hypothetical protein
MAILLSLKGMSMGNTCQLPVSTPVVAVECSYMPTKHKLAAREEVEFSEVVIPPNGRNLPAALSHVPFSSLLHNHILLCTGSAQCGLHFELQPEPVPVHSLK